MTGQSLLNEMLRRMGAEDRCDALSDLACLGSLWLQQMPDGSLRRVDPRSVYYFDGKDVVGKNPLTSGGSS